ncbi:preprotein translocase subunit SecA [Paracrocinitomix mangrovi]|uniref:preprotein translocase subunit SecA n=1 Tax=Paracrocinitomix mangrovi TaxID=2862509 RepID=UPI001C8D5690|nr:preprotein translocase subunit SecA [Paracrocinitomix mangrovi]UKN03132.1 preprotein translocase subunit SecA [Paracrocinitomix mangrovi]
MLNIFKKVVGSKSKKDDKIFQPYVDLVKSHEASIKSLSNDELRGKTIWFQDQIKKATQALEDEITSLTQKVEDNPQMDFQEKEDIYTKVDKLKKEVDVEIEKVLENILPEAFAVVKETAFRFANNTEITVTASEYDKELAAQKDFVTINGDQATYANSWNAAGAEITWNMVHYDVQLYGGTVLHKGNIAEMQTGEGKTLVATLPVYLNALSGKGVHVVTVNDYLAKRDSEWMGPLYQFHGLTVDCIDKHSPNSPGRKAAYRANITFGTNNEFGFDYLRDNMSSDPEQIVQHKHHFAIIDEVDSVLIDDARTPLIISGPTAGGDKHEFNELKPKIEKVVSAQRKLINDLLITAKKKLAGLESGDIDKETLQEGSDALLRCYRGLPKNKALIKFLSEPGIRAQLQKTENYYLQDREREMPKIDKELFFVINEKHNQIDLTEKGIDLLAEGEDANYYILPDIATEMNDIEKSGIDRKDMLKKKDELVSDYKIKSERIHSMNQLLKAYTLFEKEVEYVLMEGKVKIVDEQTGRIMDGRRYSDGLHQAIEAKENVTVEAATQTYATVTLQNFFRMYHKLSGMTGTAETEAQEMWDIYKLDVVVIPTNKPISRKDEQDLVFKTQREKFNAVIEEVNKLVDAGRPVLVGTTTVEISELLSKMLRMRGIPHNVLNAKQHQKESEIVAEAGQAGKVTIATNMAGRGTDIKLSKEVIDAGGLAIIGTERHDSRRVDRQLRGRAGRQGDPGSSQFFVSLEDDLMRKFGSERIAKIMDRMGYKEGEVIQHSMITKSIERAQKKVEENAFGVRKRLLEYDDVMNAQRNAIYKKRRNALFGDRLELDVSNMFYDVVEEIINDHYPAKDFESFEIDLVQYLRIESPVSREEFESGNPNVLMDTVYDAAIAAYNEKSEQLIKLAKPVIEQVHNNESEYKQIAFPITDGEKSINCVIDLEKAYKSEGKMLKKQIEKVITLGFIDNEWKEHLRKMDDLRTAVQHASIEQKDPLVIYKKESYDLFRDMLGKMSKEVVGFLSKGMLPNQAQPVQQKAVGNEFGQSAYQNASEHHETEEFQGSEGYEEAMANSGNHQNRPPKKQPITTAPKIGRNDKVEIRNMQTGETRVVKFKQAEPLLKSGQWMIVKQEA